MTLQGDLFQASEEPDGSISGRDLVALLAASARRRLVGAGASLLRPRRTRYTDNGGGGFVVNTYDLSVQHSFALGGWNDIVWGAGDRVIAYDIENTPTLAVPAGGPHAQPRQYLRPGHDRPAADG